MKYVKRALVGFLAVIVLVCFGTFIYHGIKTKQEIVLLKEKGYYNPVSVGDYCLNVARFGK